MRRLRFFILFFCVALSMPLAWFIVRTYQGLEKEETAELRFFADTLFDEMEEELALWVSREESRAIDEYNYLYTPSQGTWRSKPVRSPLSSLPGESYILGYFQNNPDGSFQSPLEGEDEPVAGKLAGRLDTLKNLNREFNRKRTETPSTLRIHSQERIEIRWSKKKTAVKQEKTVSLAGKYFSWGKRQKTRLGQSAPRVEEITVHQADNVLRKKSSFKSSAGSDISADDEKKKGQIDKEVRGRPISKSDDVMTTGTLRVEVDPMQSVFIDDDRIFVFRRIAVQNRIYRQGFIIDTKKFLSWFSDRFFSEQPMAKFTRLDLRVTDRDRETASFRSGAPAEHPVFSLARDFTRPFSFLRAELVCENIPRSSGRRTLSVMIFALAAVILTGLFAIYKSARTVVDLSERRSKFVSSVTHELKTPLTNIRMYIEMLEQGIAPTPDREQEYFRILGSESARLSRLINNVLEFSRLEKKKLVLDMQEGDFEDVLREVVKVMSEKLRQEGFSLNVEREVKSTFKYDREVMIQVLINLIENSVKFGKNADDRTITLDILCGGEQAEIAVRDSGPGIPRHALKKVFDDFYRVESSVTGTTRGTGIGLAFVKKFVNAMGGSVAAKNNDGAGCTIVISLPV